MGLPQGPIAGAQGKKGNAKSSISDLRYRKKSKFRSQHKSFRIILSGCESHTKINSDHLILFYIKDCDFVFILFKNTRSKLVFNQIKLDANMFDDNSMKKIGGNLDNNQIRMIFFSE